MGKLVSVSATGGNGVYAWSAPGASTSAGSGATFVTSYPAAGTNTLTVTSAGQKATCQVVVPPPPMVRSCAGADATIRLPLEPPTGTVDVMVPPGQVAHFLVQTYDRRVSPPIITDYDFPNVTGNATFTVPLVCFPKLMVSCLNDDGIAFFFYEIGQNRCVQ